MKRLFYWMVFCGCFLLLCDVAVAKGAGQPEGCLPIADPYVLLHDGTYYAYGTNAHGFEVYVSKNLKTWKKGERLALSPDDSWGTKWFWAPEVYYVESKCKFYMFYSVEEHICVAVSDRPEGPFVQEEKRPVWEEKSIDTHLFIDDDGTPYLYFVRFTDGNVIWVAEMTPDLKSIKKETLKQCIRAEEGWERVRDKVAEGPSVLKKDGVYYLVYSTNHYMSHDYAVGYATASSPTGPWKKYAGNPVLRRDHKVVSGLFGTGHGAPFVCKDGSYKYIFHAHWSEGKVQPRTSFIADFKLSDDGVITIGGKLIRPVVKKK